MASEQAYSKTKDSEVFQVHSQHWHQTELSYSIQSYGVESFAFLLNCLLKLVIMKKKTCTVCIEIRDFFSKNFQEVN